LYTAKGAGALAVPLSNDAAELWGWPAVFAMFALLSATAAALSIGVKVGR